MVRSEKGRQVEVRRTKNVAAPSGKSDLSLRDEWPVLAFGISSRDVRRSIDCLYDTGAESTHFSMAAHPTKQSPVKRKSAMDCAEQRQFRSDHESNGAGNIVVNRFHAALHQIRLMPESRAAGIAKKVLPPHPM